MLGGETEPRGTKTRSTYWYPGGQSTNRPGRKWSPGHRCCTLHNLCLPRTECGQEINVGCEAWWSVRSKQAGFLQGSNWNWNRSRRDQRQAFGTNLIKIIWRQVSVEETHIQVLPVDAERAQDHEESHSDQHGAVPKCVSRTDVRNWWSWLSLRDVPPSGNLYPGPSILCTWAVCFRTLLMHLALCSQLFTFQYLFFAQGLMDFCF